MPSIEFVTVHTGSDKTHINTREYCMKKILSLILLVLFPASFAFAADVTLEELKSQISSLQDEVVKMSRRVDKNEVHRIKDKVTLGVELRSKVESISYKDMRALSGMANDMLGLWMRGGLINTTGAATDWDSYTMTGAEQYDGFNDAFVTEYGQEFFAFMGQLVMDSDIQAAMGTTEMQTWIGNNAASIAAAAAGAGLDISDPTAATFQTYYSMAALMVYMGELFDTTTITASQKDMMKLMFNKMSPRKYDTNNSSIFTNKLRIRLNSRVNDKLSFTGRLVMYKVWGDATDVQWMDGTYKTMYMDGNAAAVPTDDKIHVERAYFVYKNEIGDLGYHFSFGRRPAAYGPGKENAEYSALGGSPVSSIIQWNFDGISLQFDFENLIEFLPGSFFKICYGRGYESGWGSSNATSANNGLIATPEVDDVDLLGFIIKFYDDEQYKLWYNYARGFGMTDGFTGSVVMPYSITGMDYNLDGEYDEYQFDPNWSGSSSRTEATAEVGDMEWHAVMAQGETFGFSWFASAAMSKSHPDGRSKAAMYQFMDMDTMLGTDESKTGTSYWVGIATPALPFTGGKLGFEYNQGSKYWVAMTGAEDDLVNSKTAVRGKVYELYYHQPIVSNRLFATIGYQHFDYEYTGSGSYLGAPVKIEDATALNTMTAVADKVDKVYASFTYRY
jgi:hypothetical protein